MQNSVTAPESLRISIITPCRNGAKFIAEAVEGVKRQGISGVEHIVMDACSTDGTLEVLAKYPDVTVVSEPDHGSHDAMNRGLSRASGDIVAFLNADDFYLPGVLAAVREAFRDPDVDAVVGRTVMFTDTDGQKEIAYVRPHEKGRGFWLSELTLGVPAINGCFFRQRVFERFGNFNNDYDFGADRHFLIRLGLAGIRSVWLDRTVLCYRLHGGSRTFNREMRNLLAIHREHFRMSWELAGKVGGAAHRLLLAWHAFEGAKLGLRCALRQLWREATATFLTLTRRDPIWAFRLPRAVASLMAVRAQDWRAKKAAPVCLSDLLR